jgi:hypothetical protein
MQGFYENIDELLLPITAPDSELGASFSPFLSDGLTVWAERYSSALQVHVLDLLCFSVQQHGFRIKYHMLKQNVAERALRLIRHRERFVQLGMRAREREEIRVGV